MVCLLAGKESKTARKRRKRRELANKAAEEELAEISLEQQVKNNNALEFIYIERLRK